MPNPTVIILKTAPENMKGVIDRQKHALQVRITRARPGDLLLVAEQRPTGPALARYAMWFEDQHLDDSGESEAIWGKHWKFIVEGEGGRDLVAPFAPSAVKPNSRYGRGGPFVYVTPDDAEDFRRDGRLAPFL